MRGNSLKLYTGSIVGVIAAVAGLSLLADRVDRTGQQFFQTGATIVRTLERVAGALSAQDLIAAQQFFSDRFQGTTLGLGSPEQVDEKDGLRHSRFRGGAVPLDRTAAMEEWRSYLESFRTIEDLRMHLDRLREWDEPERLVASVRYEFIGTPKGSSQAIIDRGYFLMEFEVLDGALRITNASLIEGERIESARPQFRNVAPEAGISFLNQYYPAFLNQALRFGMIRYGPAGISAADYDNDGFYDLFIPDGVESRLFRNAGDGTFEDATAGMRAL